MSLLINIRKRISAARKKIFYSKFIRKGDLCFDIGANVGEKATIFLSLGAKVIAVEPQSRCIRSLERLKKKFGDRLVIVQKAVGDRAATAELHLGNVSEISTLSDKFIKQFGKHGDLSWDKTEKVEVTTLQQLLEEFGVPYFCKIDTEGFEKKAISTLSVKIPFIEFEYTPPFLSETKDCLTMLKRFGDPVFNYNKYEQPVLELSHWVRYNEMIKKLERMPKDIVHGNIFAKFL